MKLFQLAVAAGPEYVDYDKEINQVNMVKTRMLAKKAELVREQVFTLDGITFFTMGGASSHNIWNGILEPDASLISWRRSSDAVNLITGFLDITTTTVPSMSNLYTNGSRSPNCVIGRNNFS